MQLSSHSHQKDIQLNQQLLVVFYVFLLSCYFVVIIVHSPIVSLQPPLRCCLLQFSHEEFREKHGSTKFCLRLHCGGRLLVPSRRCFSKNFSLNRRIVSGSIVLLQLFSKKWIRVPTHGLQSLVRRF
jgi:hypothetical protein